jgi:multidrug efflux system membrane fusion protein
VTIRTRVDGQIVKVNFTEGQIVHENREPLFEIDSRPFEVQREQAQGQLARDQAQLENAKIDVQRYKIAADAVPQQQLATALATVAQFEGAVKTDQATIDNATLQIAYCHILAPISGRIGLRNLIADVGNMVHASDATGMAVITQIQPIAVRFSLSEDSIPQFIDRVKNGTPLSVEAYDRARLRRLAVGSILAAESQIDESTGMLRLKARFENEDGMLYPNQFVNVRLLVDTRKNSVIVPSAAIQPSPKSTFVYVVKPGEDRTVQLRPVVCGPEEGSQTVIESGLAAGEEVVIDGVDKLQEGSKVTVAAPTTRPGAGPTTAATSRPKSAP